jgi:hypothetical protein
VGTRGRAVVWGVGLTLVGAIGVLWAINAAGPDPDQIKAELAARIDDLNKIPTTDAIRREALAKELLDDERYRQHAKALWLKLERAYRAIQTEAQAERAARKEVPPFLARCKELSAVPPAAVQALYDELRAHLDNYGMTRFGADLRKVEAELKARLEALPKSVTSLDVVELNRKTRMLVAGSQFDEALRLIEEFLRRPGAREVVDRIDPSAKAIQAKADAARRAPRPR